MEIEDQPSGGEGVSSSVVEKDSGSTNENIPVMGDGSQVVEVDRMSTDSPMFNDPQEQDILASSSSSEDALKSLEKLENLARLAENAALEDRDVETPQSFVNAEDVNDDIGVTDEISEEANNTKTDYYSGDRDSPTTDVADAFAEPSEENIAHGGTDENESSPENRDFVVKIQGSEADPRRVDSSNTETTERSNNNHGDKGTETEAEQEQFETALIPETMETRDEPKDQDGHEICASLQNEHEHQDGRENGSDGKCEENMKNIDDLHAEQKADQQQPPSQQSQTSTNTAVSMVTSYTNGIRPASPIHESDDELVAVKPKVVETIASEQTQQDDRFDMQIQDEGTEKEPELKPNHQEESTDPELESAGLGPETVERESEPACIDSEPEAEGESVEPEPAPESVDHEAGLASLEPEPEAVERECAEPASKSTCAEPAPESVEPETGPASLEPEPEPESVVPISEVAEPEAETAEPEPQAAGQETERNTESPIEVIDPVSTRNSVPLPGKRTIIIEDEQTGSVTVSYGDELVRVELNESSGDEFSDVEETEEQRILRESGAQIIEDDEDDCDDELQTIDIQLENTARKSVIRSPVDRNSEASEKQNTDELLLQDKMQQSDKTSKEEHSPKANETTQKRKESKLEQSIRKISNIRERENNSESVQLETIGTITNAAQRGSKTDMPLVAGNNKNNKETPTQNSSLPGDLTLATVEYDSENEMVIDERTENERMKQQRKDARRKANRPRPKESTGSVTAGGMKILGTVQVIENDTTELCTVQASDDIPAEARKGAGDENSISEPITIEPSGTLPAPPPLISDDVIITGVKPNADVTAFKPMLQIKQEKEDSGYNQYQQFVKQPPPPPYRQPRFPMTQRAPIGINLSTGRAVGGGMMRGPPVSHPPYHRHPTPPAYVAPRALKIGIRSTGANNSPYNSPLQGMSNIVRNQGQQPRMSQALINVVMPGSPITSGQRPSGVPPQQPNMRLMGPASFTTTTTVPIQIMNPPVTSGGMQNKTVTVVIPSRSNTTNTSPATHNKVVGSVNSTSTSHGGSKKVTSVKVSSQGNSNVGFIKKLSMELPTYSPPKPPEKLSMNSVAQHTCAGCQDKFTSKSSLDWHRARQSMLLTFTCRRCQKHITFSNKCALLSHISSHGIFYQAVEKALSEGNLIIKPLHSAKNGKNASLPAPVSAPGAAVTGKTNAKPNKTNRDAETGIKKNSSVLAKTIAMDPELDKLIQKSKEIKQSSQQKSKGPSKSAESESTPPKNIAVSAPSQPVTKDKEPTPKRKEIKILPKPSPAPISTKPAKVDHAQLQCAECGKHVPHHAALKSHFNAPSPEQKQVAACRNKMCNMVLPTVCARDAHERYTHFQASKPHVCPECGIECGSNIKVFRKHLSQICFHLCRIMVYCCPKCSFVTKFAEQIVEHAVDAHGEKYHKCLQCPMAFKSRSTFVGHCKNAHKYDDNGEPDTPLPPHKLIFKCPMCDTVFHKYQQLQDHLVQHYPDTKKVQKLGFKCPRCDTLVRGNKNQLIDHLKTKHNVTEFVTHMCHICGRVFSSDNEKNIHIIQMHPDVVSSASAVVPSNVTEQKPAKPETKREAEETNTSKTAKPQQEKPATKEKLPAPSTPPVSKPGPASSKKRSMSPASSVESASSAGSKPPKRRASPVMELVTGSRNSGQRTLCNRCGIRFESDVDYTKHMRIHESRKRTAVESKKNPAGLKKPKVEIPEEKPNVNKMQVRLKEEPPHVPCNDCDMQFKTEKEREKHMQNEHAHVPQFPCHLCGLTYLARPQLENHVMTVHEGKSKSCMYTCWICLENNVHKSYQKKPLLESHLKSVHKIPRNQIDFSKMPDFNTNGASEAPNDDDSVASTSVENSDTSVVKRLRLDGDEQFTCAKCNFVSKEREDFQTHIAKHKSVEEDALQCHECGMSFMVMPSLKRHLFVVHKIRNLKRYQEEAGVNLESPVKPVEGMRLRISHNTVLQNGYSSRESDSARDSDTEHDSSVMECTVCYKEFESQSQLRKHMRMHGMAFIRSRRLDSGIN